MITSFAEFLLELKKKEEAILAAQKIEHAPTIGNMYEGLSKSLLQRVIPAQLDIRVVDGFVRGVDGALSPQIDCMVVTGLGERIPQTESYVWGIDDVIAVFEVKKNLYSADILDAYPKLQRISAMFTQAWTKDRKRKIARSTQAFEMTTGYPLNHASEIESLSFELQQIFQTIFIDEYAPLRIVFGYEGFASEYSLREGFLKYIESVPKPSPGYGINSFPNQIICRGHSIVVATGHPYCIPLNDGVWAPVVSTAENPLRILLELLLTRISYRFGISLPDDDSLSEEVFTPLLFATPARINDSYGWKYAAHEVSRKDLLSKMPRSWQPAFVDSTEATILLVLSSYGSVNLDGQDHLNFVQKEGRDPAEIAKKIVGLGLATLKDNTLYPVQDFMMAHLPDGRAAVAFEADRLQMWLGEQMTSKVESK